MKPSPSYLNQRLDYNPRTGDLIWNPKRVTCSHDLSWNARWAGKPAGNLDNTGYIRINLDKKKSMAHVLIWVMQTGEWPENGVDHINRDPTDLRFCNLREATVSQNKFNQKVRSDNQTGLKGVFRQKNGYRAMAQGKYVGFFHTPEEAHKAYCDAILKIAGEFARFS